MNEASDQAVQTEGSVAVGSGAAGPVANTAANIAASSAVTPVDNSVPAQPFAEMPLSNDVKQALAEMGYTHPAPVQRAVYDPASRGIDIVVQARTGTGKTAAFGIPLADQLIKRSVRAPQSLILTPTRELALQVTKELARIASKRGIRIVTVYGGAPMQKQIDALRDGAQVIVGTPGRVLDHLRRGTLIPNQLRVLILDEADEMLSMGFERDLHAIVDYLPPERQTMLFSATLPPEIVRMASTRLRNPQFIYLSGDHIGALEILHFVYLVRTDKSDALMRMLEVENPESALVFCNTKDDTERVATMLRRAGYEADWLNGDLPQSDREKVMAKCRLGKLRFLVATDVAARGIDISNLTHVINYDFPDSSESYVHRTGRTGRMGRTGTAISLVTPHDIGSLYYLRLTYKIRPFEKQLPTDSELKTRAHADVISMLATAFPAEPDTDDIALAQRLLTHDRCEHIIASLLRCHLGDKEKSQDRATEARRARCPQPSPEPVPHPRQQPPQQPDQQPRPLPNTRANTLPNALPALPEVKQTQQLAKPAVQPQPVNKPAPKPAPKFDRTSHRNPRTEP
ncbi:MAG: DEAD/DEAH box helicase, partial [Polyangiaceae bacterium]|nr:DEAD/DEAH box helicase [Polyangiaceae bacterium]